MELQAESKIAKNIKKGFRIIKMLLVSFLSVLLYPYNFEKEKNIISERLQYNLLLIRGELHGSNTFSKCSLDNTQADLSMFGMELRQTHNQLYPALCAAR